MFPRISRNSKRIIAILAQYRKPSQIAWGFAVGITIGLIPKDNLVVVLLLMLIGLLRINQLAACSTAIAFSLLNGMLNAITISIGNRLIEQQIFAGIIVFLYQFPIIPWTCLENAQVIGGLGLGAIVLLPAYMICVWALAKANYRLEHLALEQVADHAIQYRKSVTEQSRIRQSKPQLGIKLLTENAHVSAAFTPETTNVVKSDLRGTQSLEADDVQQSHKRTERRIHQRVMPTIFTGDSHWDGNDTILRETVIEVVRYRRPNPAAQPTSGIEHSPDAFPAQGISMPAGNVSKLDSENSNADSFASINSANKKNTSISFDAGHVASLANSRDESLRYLLWHINGSRESVRKSSEKTA